MDHPVSEETYRAEVRIIVFSGAVAFLGIVALVVVVVLSSSKLQSSDLAAAIGAAAGAIGSLAIAFFGIHVSATGRSQAERSHAAEAKKVQCLAVLAAQQDATEAMKIVRT